MSSGLMSCVRENSPPLELELSAAAAGPLSLPTANGRSHDYAGPTTSTPIGSPVAVEANDGTTGQQQQQQQQPKRRRSFHPLRNLRRIFRRRTINSADSVQAAAAAAAAGAGTCNTLPPPTSSASEKNLRSVSSAAASANANADAVSASSPASPLTHQQLHDSYGTQSLPKSKSYGAHRDELLSVLLGKKRANKQQQLQQQHNADADPDADVMYQTQRQPLGVAVFPDAMSMSRSSYFAEHHHHRQLRSIGDSTHEVNGAAGGAADISDSQRSLSEARLLDVDGDYTRETLSQSHDSVFSESATASSLSIVLKAELTDVLRKRRNRPDASDEDLGLPHSPVSPQRHVGGGAQSRKANAYATRGGHNNVQQDVSSLSLLSVHSTDNEDQSHSHSYSQSYRQQQTTSASSRISSSSSVSMSSEILRQKPAEEEVDAVGLERQRLSHAAAKHKMAIRPVKKKGPSRQHRRTLETAIPEANEQELLKLSQSPSLKAVQDVELKSKTRSLPAGSSLKPVEATTKVAASSSSSSNNTTKLSINSSSSSSSHMFGLRSLTIKAPQGESSTDGDVLTSASDASEPGFLRRLMQRNSKRSIARANDGLEDVDHSQSVAKKLQISTSCLEATTRAPNMPLPNKSRSATSHEQHIQETRQLIKREIHSEGKQGLQAMVSNYGVQPQPPTPLKPKSGPAARQRYVPQELGAQLEEDCLQSSALVQHFERKPRFVGLSSLQQKLTRSNDSMGQHSSSSNSLETSTDEPSPLYYEEKQRKTVEKSRSFRHQQQQQQHHQQQQQQQLDAASPLNSNMPSLPDLSISFRLPASYYNSNSSSSPSSPLSPQGKCVSLGFEINDNQLLQARAGDSSKALHSPQRGSKLLLNSPSANNITQIEQNIDLIVKSPLVNVLRKSGAPASEQLQLHLETPPPPKRPQQLALKQTTTETPKASPQSSNSNSNSSNCSPEQPEFMKIQLNRVDQARLHQKANLVLAKNVKELRSQSSDDLSLRRLSNDSSSSIHITERAQAPSKSSNATPTSSSSSSSNATPTTAHSISLSSSSERLSTPTTPKAKAQPQSATESSSKRVSLEERKRLFLAQEQQQAKLSERKLHELRFERKQSINEERKPEPIDTPPSVEHSPVEPSSPAAVVLRKKSFASNSNTNSSSCNNSNSCNSNAIVATATPSHEDGTPELMKVFARRSLKVKDDDVVAAAIATAAAAATTPSHKKLNAASQSVDSDKENQSNSEEKLDKLPAVSNNMNSSSSSNHASSNSNNNNNNNRNSVADFRNLNKNNNNNNSKLPPIKLSNVRSSSNNSGKSNSNSSNNNNNSKSKPATERFSLQLKPATAAAATNNNNNNTAAAATVAAVTTATTGSSSKTIERSATVGEFKGIHQRRAEWEQRVKEALK